VGVNPATFLHRVARTADTVNASNADVRNAASSVRSNTPRQAAHASVSTAINAAMAAAALSTG
jgi:hypothetical protein